MGRGRGFERLTGQDAGYLRRETDAQPMHFVVLMRADPSVTGPVTLEQVRAHVAARLHRTPALRRRLKRAPGGFGGWVWVDDRRFAVDRQVVAWPVRVRDDTELVAAFAAVTTARLPLDRPLWRLNVGPVLPDGARVLALAVHHALMDGGLLAHVLDDLFGPQPVPPPDPAGRRRPGREPSGARLLADALARRITRPARPAGSAGGVARPAPATAPRVLTGPVGPRRAVTVRTLPLDDLREVRRVCGATINDIYLSVVAEGLHTLLVGRGAGSTERLLALVPRDVRRSEDRATPGNRTWSMLVDLPVGPADAATRLTAVQARTAEAKARDSSAGTAGFHFDVALSNIRLGGPHVVAGGRIGDVCATAPLQGDNRLLAVAASHDRDFTVAFTADADRFPDLETLADATAAAFRRLQREVRPTSRVE